MSSLPPSSRASCIFLKHCKWNSASIADKLNTQRQTGTQVPLRNSGRSFTSQIHVRILEVSKYSWLVNISIALGEKSVALEFFEGNKKLLTRE